MEGHGLMTIIFWLISGYGRGEDPEMKVVDNIALWIQVHQLPIGYMSDSVVQRIGAKLGGFLELNPSNYTRLHPDYMRLRIKQFVSKPLKSHLCLKQSNGGGKEVLLKNERLPTFYFKCGLLGHGERFCKLNYEAADGEAPQKFGPELRAPNRSR